VFTVGHSNRSLAEFIALLQEHRIELLVDVRSYPSSRRHPQFNQGQLERELPPVGVRYLWLGHELGGMRDSARADSPHHVSPHHALEDGGFRNYADHMGTSLFAMGIGRLLAEARSARVACMCAEKDWHECHRRYLSDALMALHDTPVSHIRDKSAPEAHTLHEVARVVDGALRYDAGGQRQATLF